MTAELGHAGSEARYRDAEAALFRAAGIEPAERFVHLRRLGRRIRVLEVGDPGGEPTVFVQGGPNVVATFAYLVANTEGLRCLLVERPGTGLSPPPRSVPDDRTMPAYVETLTADILDGLDLDRANLAGSSWGGYCVLRGAMAHPERVRRLVLLGSPAFVPGWAAPRYFTLLRTPLIGRLLLRLPPSERMVRLSLGQMGHGASLAAGTIPQPMLVWIKAWQRHTDTMANDGAMIRASGTRRHGFPPALDLNDDELASITRPTLALIGTDDPVGSDAVGRHLIEVMGDATLDLWDGAGHLPWLDDPVRAGRRISEFLGVAHDLT